MNFDHVVGVDSGIGRAGLSASEANSKLESVSTVLFGLHRGSEGRTNQDLAARHVTNKRSLIRGGLVLGSLTLVSFSIASVVVLQQEASASAAAMLLVACQTLSCLNGASCFLLPNATSICLCSATFTGQRCEQRAQQNSTDDVSFEMTSSLHTSMHGVLVPTSSSLRPLQSNVTDVMTLELMTSLKDASDVMTPPDLTSLLSPDLY